jgi:hypothetical protein
MLHCNMEAEMTYFQRIGRQLSRAGPLFGAPSDPDPERESLPPVTSEAPLQESLDEQTNDTLPMIHLNDA